MPPRTIDPRKIDPRNIEVIDDQMAEVLRRKTPAQRLAIGLGMWSSTRRILLSVLASQHPDWDPQRVEREVARRMSRDSG